MNKYIPVMKCICVQVLYFIIFTVVSSFYFSSGSVFLYSSVGSTQTALWRLCTQTGARRRATLMVVCESRTVRAMWWLTGSADPLQCVGDVPLVHTGSVDLFSLWATFHRLTLALLTPAMCAPCSTGPLGVHGPLVIALMVMNIDLLPSHLCLVLVCGYLIF